MRKVNSFPAFLLCFLVVSSSLAQELPPAAELLDKSIAHHDPDGIWYSQNHEVILNSTRPSGPDRITTIYLNHNMGQFGMEMERDGKVVETKLMGDDCEATVNGTADFSEEDKKAFRLTCEGITRWRDYHGYMLGLPMNLYDPGTILDPVANNVTFQGKDVISLKVTYEEGVGADTWYFYLDLSNYAVMGCRFYHDESKNDGEYLTFEGEVSSGSIILPKTRKWYINKDDEFLGEDEITGFDSGQ